MRYAALNIVAIYRVRFGPERADWPFSWSTSASCSQSDFGSSISFRVAYLPGVQYEVNASAGGFCGKARISTAHSNGSATFYLGSTSERCGATVDCYYGTSGDSCSKTFSYPLAGVDPPPPAELSGWVFF